MVNRRNFLRTAMGATAFLIEPGIVVANPLGLPLGCQTYPVREEIQGDFADTIQGLRAAGFTSVELVRRSVGIIGQGGSKRSAFRSRVPGESSLASRQSARFGPHCRPASIYPRLPLWPNHLFGCGRLL